MTGLVIGDHQLVEPQLGDLALLVRGASDLRLASICPRALPAPARASPPRSCPSRTRCTRSRASPRRRGWPPQAPRASPRPRRQPAPAPRPTSRGVASSSPRCADARRRPRASPARSGRRPRARLRLSTPARSRKGRASSSAWPTRVEPQHASSSARASSGRSAFRRAMPQASRPARLGDAEKAQAAYATVRPDRQAREARGRMRPDRASKHMPRVGKELGPARARRSHGPSADASDRERRARPARCPGSARCRSRSRSDASPPRRASRRPTPGPRGACVASPSRRSCRGRARASRARAADRRTCRSPRRRPRRSPPAARSTSCSRARAGPASAGRGAPRRARAAAPRLRRGRCAAARASHARRSLTGKRVPARPPRRRVAATISAPRARPRAPSSGACGRRACTPRGCTTRGSCP